MSLNIIILAAGRGTRMKSQLPKVLHPVAGKPMLRWIAETAITLNPKAIYPVIGFGAAQVRAQLNDLSVECVEQTEQLGTGHAVQQVLPLLDANDQVLVLVGDNPLISEATLTRLIDVTPKDGVGLLTVSLDNPTGLGRIIRDAKGQAVEIVEEKDASTAQRAITEINAGIYVFAVADLQRWLPNLKSHNQQGELYLTDVIAMAVAEGKTINTTHPDQEQEIWSVNDRVQLARLERYRQEQMANEIMLQGVTLHDPKRFDLRGELNVGQDVVIDVNVIIEGKVSLGNYVSIGPNVILKNVTIGDNTIIKSNCDIEDAIIAEQCEVGPFARLRPGTHLAKGAKVGNFVETKKANIGAGSKVSHLTYLGDAEIGKGVNIGAGTITCNYDGMNKFTTTIKDGAFIGSNSSLVAPVTIGKDATTIKGWQRPKKKD